MDPLAFFFYSILFIVVLMVIAYNLVKSLIKYIFEEIRNLRK